MTLQPTRCLSWAEWFILMLLLPGPSFKGGLPSECIPAGLDPIRMVQKLTFEYRQARPLPVLVKQSSSEDYFITFQLSISAHDREWHSWGSYRNAFQVGT